MMDIDVDSGGVEVVRVVKGAEEVPTGRGLVGEILSAVFARGRVAHLIKQLPLVQHVGTDLRTS